MKTAVDDTCLTTFKDFKFRNIASRFIVYKIDHERIVPSNSYRSSKQWEKSLKLGQVSSPNYPQNNTDIVYLMLNSPTTIT